MRCIFYTIFSLAWLAASVYSAESPPPKPSWNDELARAIKTLRADDFDMRENAEKTLLELSREREDEALAALKAAAKKTNVPEALQRLEKLIRQLDVAGKKDWSVEAGLIYQLPAVSGGRVYVGNKDQFLYCLDAATGTVIWRFAVGGFIYKSVAAADGRVFVIRTRKNGRPDGAVIALDANDGRELWQWQDDVRSQYFTAPIPVNGALFFAREKKLIRLNALNGVLEWSYDADDSIVSPPSVAGGRVLVGTLESGLHCVSEHSGEKLWIADFEGSCNSGGVLNAGAVYAGAGTSLYCLDLQSGKTRWEYRGNEAVTTAPAVAGRQVFASFGMVFRCIDVQTGRALWDRDTGGHIFAAPAIVHNRVYFGALNDKLTLYCFDASSGDELWTHVTQEGGYAEPILSGRRLFMGYHSKFYTLNTGVPGPANWPMSGGNPARNGCNDE